VVQSFASGHTTSQATAGCFSVLSVWMPFSLSLLGTRAQLDLLVLLDNWKVYSFRF
jgi:hypothetical protein